MFMLQTQHIRDQLISQSARDTDRKTLVIYDRILQRDIVAHRVMAELMDPHTVERIGIEAELIFAERTVKAIAPFVPAYRSFSGPP